MSEIIKKELETPVFGFINNGNICYFNSLLQCIINCKQIMYYLVNEHKPKNEIQEFFQTKFKNFVKMYNNEEIQQFKKETSIFSYELLKKILNKYKHININEQQSSSEFFLYLIEELDIEHYFKIKHKINIHCGNCKNISTKTDECFHFEMFCDNNLKDNKIDIDDFLYSVNIIDDYKCEKCNTVSKSMYEKQALNISKYFVIILNKYFNKVLIQFPNKFELTVKNFENNQNLENYIPKNYIWENISQIEHIGNLNSGHYIAICKRFDKIFNIDDNKVEIKNGKMEPSKNTYVVFFEEQ